MKRVVKYKYIIILYITIILIKKPYCDIKYYNMCIHFYYQHFKRVALVKGLNQTSPMFTVSNIRAFLFILFDTAIDPILL